MYLVVVVVVNKGRSRKEEKNGVDAPYIVPERAMISVLLRLVGRQQGSERNKQKNQNYGTANLTSTTSHHFSLSVPFFLCFFFVDTNICQY